MPEVTPLFLLILYDILCNINIFKVCQGVSVFSSAMHLPGFSPSLGIFLHLKCSQGVLHFPFCRTPQPDFRGSPISYLSYSMFTFWITHIKKPSSVWCNLMSRYNLKASTTHESKQINVKPMLENFKWITPMCKFNILICMSAEPRFSSSHQLTSINPFQKVHILFYLTDNSQIKQP